MERAHATSGMLAGVLAKMPRQVARLALTLHAAEHGPECQRCDLQQETLEAAIKVGDYFARMAARVLAHLGGVDSRLVGLSPERQKLLSYLTEHGPAATGTIAEEMELSAPAVLNLLNRLASAGLAKRAKRGVWEATTEIHTPCEEVNSVNSVNLLVQVEPKFTNSLIHTPCEFESGGESPYHDAPHDDFPPDDLDIEVDWSHLE
jgi:DNA-binding transcriptional ArsR family regulator